MSEATDTAAEREKLAALFVAATSDDCLRQMVPSDLRGLIAGSLRLLDALDAERAKVAAAYEAAGDKAADYMIQTGFFDADRQAYTIRIALCALTPADAEAALQRVVDAARLEGWRAGRDAAAETAFGWPSTHDAAMVHLSNAIRALPEPKENCS